jgi:hypothetical protein
MQDVTVLFLSRPGRVPPLIRAIPIARLLRICARLIGVVRIVERLAVGAVLFLASLFNMDGSENIPTVPR